MENLKSSELNTLYTNFVVYRDTVCGGMAKMSVSEFYKKFGLNPWKA